MYINKSINPNPKHKYNQNNVKALRTLKQGQSLVLGPLMFVIVPVMSHSNSSNTIGSHICPLPPWMNVLLSYNRETAVS